MIIPTSSISSGPADKTSLRLPQLVFMAGLSADCAVEKLAQQEEVLCLAQAVPVRGTGPERHKVQNQVLHR